MSTISGGSYEKAPDGEPVFVSWTDQDNVHMATDATLLDFMAAHALNGQLAMHADPEIQALPSYRDLAIRSYGIAQAMLAERKRLEGQS